MRRSISRRHTLRRGFTLMEVLLVLIILVVIGGLVANNFIGIREGALQDAARTQMLGFKKALELYELQVGSMPSDLSALRERPGDLADPARWKGPYLKEDVPKDPWGNDYNFKGSGSGFTISSNGPDGQSGTEDDIEVKQE